MTKPKKILNTPEASVEEFIEGLLLQYPNHLARLETHDVVLAAQQQQDTVQLISGGGSGHEPSHAGWIGQGMLSAAVCGGMFASPSVAAVLAAIQAIGSDKKGVLLIIKNYTGDRLNFGVAAERANLLGIPVRTIVVADDCALPRTKGVTGARGLAGTVLVHKITGAAAAAGASLEACHAMAKRVCARMGTLGIALDAVTVPGASAVNDRLDDEDTIEIGLGIHGEAGLKQSKLLTADEMAAEMVQTIQAYGRTDDQDSSKITPLVKPGDEVVILVNNLGGTSNFEMSILARSCVKVLEGSLYQVKVSRVLVGSYMTSFDMHGASLTILNATGQADMVEYLDASCTAPAWGKCDVWNTKAGDRPSSKRVAEAPEGTASVALPQPTCNIADFENIAKKVLQAASTALSEAEPLLTKYDTVVGDGDCGITMKRGATQILQDLQSDKLGTSHPVALFSGLSQSVSASMGGTSGILLELLLGKMASTLAQESEITAASIATAFAAGVDAVQLYGGATVGSRTMLDAMVPAAQVWKEMNSLEQAAETARRGADGTAQMGAASAGRSNYLSQESLQGTPDPGAIAVAIVLEACVAALE
mmetsp:Transcript_5846/g.11434  ORF Transcript_5846/g.11434 Transcript_5846/m.11434 type:complete len:592 (-) Transcript_5846:165-1940(-)|eukprot:scaffold4223_cov189-Amphora_coffeaeformis.AAC.33